MPYFLYYLYILPMLPVLDYLLLCCVDFENKISISIYALFGQFITITFVLARLNV